MLNEFNGHTHRVNLGSKDKLRFHLVGRLKVGINSFVSNLASSITTRYLGF
jgi:hypothetical protein